MDKQVIVGWLKRETVRLSIGGDTPIVPGLCSGAIPACLGGDSHRTGETSVL